ncbi:methyltransferase domain-containing protein [Flavobacteriaceae bacterium]|nr:methyltransferase domain-containing protein [Flavobacteriaceae bacterium]
MQYNLKDFNRDKTYNVYLSPNTQEKFNYSDGKIENKIFKILDKSNDNSVFSKELIDQIVDWPTEYHLSPLRHNLLRHIDFKRTDNILELGCGCGAITRQLGETGASVSAVEGSINRAKSASARCKDLSNVKVYVSNFQNVIFENQFDYVTLIGVLEYSPVYINEENPFKTVLDIAKRALKPNGKLIIAIENRLGLKYFMGLSEDHGNPPFFGIQDLYNKQTAKTFGRKELQNLLLDNEFNDLEFQYPFPDYKIPEVVFFESAFNTSKFSPSDIISQLFSRDYSGTKSELFSEKLVWPMLDSNKLIPSLSNSFLVIAGLNLSKEEYKSQNILAVKYTVDRKSEFNTLTEFVKDNDDKIVVKKKNISPSNNSDSDFSQDLQEGIYHRGKNLGLQVDNAINLDNFDEFIKYIKLWIDFIILNGIKEKDVENVYNSKLLPEYIDCIPKNLMITDNGLEYIDKEWLFKKEFVIYSIIIKYFWDIDRDFINKHIDGNKNSISKLFIYLEIPLNKILLVKQHSFNKSFNKLYMDYPKYYKSFFHINKKRRIIFKLLNVLPENILNKVPLILKEIVKKIVKRFT